MGLASRVLEDEDREWLARASAWTQLFCVSWLGICGLVLLVPGWAFEWKTWAQVRTHRLRCGRRLVEHPRRHPSRRQAADKPGIGALFVRYGLKLAPALFVLTLVIGLSALTNWLLYESGALFALQRHRMDAAGVVGARSTPRTHAVVLRDRGRRASLRAELDHGALHQHQQILAPRHVPQPFDPRVSGRLQPEAQRQPLHRFRPKRQPADARLPHQFQTASRRQSVAQCGLRRTPRLAAAKGAGLFRIAALLRKP